MTAQFVDTHCHLNFDSFNDDRSEVIERAATAGVTRIIVPAIDLETCAAVSLLAGQYAGVYAAVGVHPNSTADWEDEHLSRIEAFAANAKVCAIGEIGLDYHWNDSPRPMQFAAFEAQLALAAQLQLPVIIHNRESSEDVMAILESWVNTLPTSLRERPGVLHSFSGDAAIAERALAAGFYLGFTGPLTYKNADATRAIAAAIPLSRLLLETDAPFLTPQPHRGKRNEPSYIPLIAERLAALKNISLEQLAEATTENAARLFRL
jgi:TatD DNase family protein